MLAVLLWVFFVKKYYRDIKQLHNFPGVELVGPKKRVLVGSIVSSCYAVGEVMAAGSAWIFQSWR